MGKRDDCGSIIDGSDERNYKMSYPTEEEMDYQLGKIVVISLGVIALVIIGVILL